MRKLSIWILLIAISSMLNVRVFADSYSTFKTTKYYSPNRKYFVRVRTNKTAALFLNGRHPRRVWACTLREIPLEVIVSDDSRRVALVDFYYGNSGNPTARVVILLNKNGKEITSYSLEELANLPKVLETTSTAHWYKDTHLSEDGRFVMIDTQIAKRDPKTCMHVNSAEEADECFKSVPYERLKIDMTTGRLVERLKLTER